jgi:nucleotide-binding universal stress UspA family protein/MFS family permease
MARPFVDYSQDPAHSYPLVTLVSRGEEDAGPRRVLIRGTGEHPVMTEVRTQSHHGHGGGGAASLRPGPLAGNYPAATAMVLLLVIPYLGLSAALQPITPFLSAQLHMTPQTASIADGLANAAYAVGTVLALQLAQILPQRRLMLVYACALVIGSVLAASATGAGLYIAGHVLQGLFTSMLLIAAVPQLVLGFPARNLRYTVMVIDMCIFGAVAAGPLVGGALASFHAWRPLFWIVAGIAAAGLLMALLTFQDAPPADRSAPRDVRAIGLAAAGSVGAFWGAAELTTHGFTSPVVLGPLLGGLALIIVLWVYQYRSRNPLLRLRSFTNTIPVGGTVVAICAAAAATSAIGLTATVLGPHYPALRVGLLFVPELGATVIAAIIFGLVFNTRYIHYFALIGIIVLIAGILVLQSAVPPTQTLTMLGSGLIGIGIGASVVPALFLAALSLRSRDVQRVLSILELFRAVAAFMVTPILAHFAVTLAGVPTPAMGTVWWALFAIAAGGVLISVLLYLVGGVRPAAPAVDAWMDGPEPAWYSPPLFAALRAAGGRAAPVGVPAFVGSVAGGDGQAVSIASGTGQPDGGPVEQRPGPLLFAYDGSGPAKAAIDEASRQLPGRDAIVVTVWRVLMVGFTPDPPVDFDAACADDVKQAAAQTAASGAARARARGLRTQARAVEGTPAWKAIIDTANDSDASLIVVGTHGRSRLTGRIAGSVAGDVAAHSLQPVLIVHARSRAGEP